MRWILALLFAVVVTTVAAIRYLPWWGVLAYLAVLVFSVPAMFKLGFALYVRKIGREMASALDGAKVEVHDIRAVPPPSVEELKGFLHEEPEPDEDGETEPQPEEEVEDELPSARNWYELELTISPDPAKTEGDDAQSWSAESLLLVPSGTPHGELSEDMPFVLRHEWWENGKYIATENRSFYAPARVRLFLGATPGSGPFVLRYMFFGKLGDPIHLPPPHRD